MPPDQHVKQGHGRVCVCGSSTVGNEQNFFEQGTISKRDCGVCGLLLLPPMKSARYGKGEGKCITLAFVVLQ